MEEIYFGEQGLLAHMPKGGYLIDMTTSSPKLAVRIYEAAKAAGLSALDAPVTGGRYSPAATQLTVTEK